MKNFKRIISFVMAMIICMSFSMVNSYASVSVDKEMPDDYYELFFPDSIYDNDSCAWVEMTNRGPNEEDTDLTAKTEVWNEFYYLNGRNNTLEIDAYVILDIQFDAWHPDALIRVSTCGAHNTGATATAEGRTLDDFDHWVEGYSTLHYLIVYGWVLNDNVGEAEYIEYQWGDTLGTSW